MRQTKVAQPIFGEHLYHHKRGLREAHINPSIAREGSIAEVISMCSYFPLHLRILSGPFENVDC
jgi:hypothetical protein